MVSALKQNLLLAKGNRMDYSSNNTDAEDSVAGRSNANNSILFGGDMRRVRGWESQCDITSS
jgi:hypothetical protein